MAACHSRWIIFYFYENWINTYFSSFYLKASQRSAIDQFHYTDMNFESPQHYTHCNAHISSLLNLPMGYNHLRRFLFLAAQHEPYDTTRWLQKGWIMTQSNHSPEWERVRICFLSRWCAKYNQGTAAFHHAPHLPHYLCLLQWVFHKRTET